MKVTAVTPVAAASDPLHPDHDRWVKETTLKMEVEHANRVGRSLRQAENENRFWLERAEAKARGLKDRPGTPKQHKRKTREERLAERPVTVRTAKPEAPKTWARISPCGRCGECIRCRREKRVLLMSQRAKEGDLKFAAILWKLGMLGMNARDLTGPYAEMNVRDANRALIRELEDICDSTVMQWGPWR